MRRSAFSSWRARPAEDGGRGTAILVGLTLASAIATAPFTAWRVVESIRTKTALPAAVARNWPEYHNYLTAPLYDYLRTELPPDATFTVAVATDIEPLAAQGAFETWPLGVRARSVQRFRSSIAGRPIYVARAER